MTLFIGTIGATGRYELQAERLTGKPFYLYTFSSFRHLALIALIS
jgi:hypothetical protein